jgi:hypothetical protein
MRGEVARIVEPRHVRSAAAVTQHAIDGFGVVLAGG